MALPTGPGEIADVTFLTAVHMQLGQPEMAWERFGNRPDSTSRRWAARRPRRAPDDR